MLTTTNTLPPVHTHAHSRAHTDIFHITGTTVYDVVHYQKVSEICVREGEKDVNNSIDMRKRKSDMSFTSVSNQSTTCFVTHITVTK